jgi:hypothetical protein
VIGGKVLDASALAALVRGRVSAAAWFATARTRDWAVLSDDAGRLRRVDPDVQIELL